MQFSIESLLNLLVPLVSPKVSTMIIWCGEGDLNPHEITPASTSSDRRWYRRVSSRPKCVICLRRAYPRVSRSIPSWLVTASSAPNYAPGRDVAVRQGVRAAVNLDLERLARILSHIVMEASRNLIAEAVRLAVLAIRHRARVPCRVETKAP